jgi:hypothetical protein
MSTSQLLQDALELKYRAQIAEAKATLSIYFENSVGIGEHPQHLEEMDKLISQLADAQDKLEALNQITFNQDQSLPILKIKI